MAKTTVVLTFENEAEARLIEAVLVEEDIPHYIRSLRDAAYGSAWPHPGGWGQLEAPLEHHDRIRVLYADIVSSRE